MTLYVIMIINGTRFYICKILQKSKTPSETDVVSVIEGVF